MLPSMSVITPDVCVGTSNCAKRVSISMPVATLVLTPVPFVETSNTSGHRPSASGSWPEPLRPVQHFADPQFAGRVPTSHAFGGTRALVCVERYVMYSCAVHDVAPAVQ